MTSITNVNWKNVYDLVLSCGSVHDTRRFPIEVISEVKKLLPYDRAQIYYLDGNGKPFDQYLENVDKKWVTAYFNYYSKLENGRYDVSTNDHRRKSSFHQQNFVSNIDWGSLPNDAFLNEYIHPLRIKYTVGIILYDLTASQRAVLMLDRTGNREFSGMEITPLCLATPQLNHLYQNLFYQQAKQLSNNSVVLSYLTPRETEIATLLCEGISSANISIKLHITLSTLYTHIAHINEKLNVSSRQELMAKLLNE